jgi:aminoglycoside phosphotransferase (APT) family kinase protein
MTSNNPGAVVAAMSAAAALGLTVDDAIVLHESNRLAVRLLPCNVLARVADDRFRSQAEFEVGLALRLAETESPAARLEPRVAPRAYMRDGFVVTLWSYHEPALSREFAPADYARALERHHSCLREIEFGAPHFTNRIADAQRLIGNRDQTPELVDEDRELLGNTLRELRQTIRARGRPEQLLHGEPHPGNVLRTETGLLLIDLETCCHGPVEFDLAYAPEEVSVLYSDANQGLIRDCRVLTVAMVAAWRWDRADQFPNRREEARELVRELRNALSGAPFSMRLPRWTDA